MISFLNTLRFGREDDLRFVGFGGKVFRLTVCFLPVPGSTGRSLRSSVECFGRVNGGLDMARRRFGSS